MCYFVVAMRVPSATKAFFKKSGGRFARVNPKHSVMHSLSPSTISRTPANWLQLQHTTELKWNINKWILKKSYMVKRMELSSGEPPLPTRLGIFQHSEKSHHLNTFGKKNILPAWGSRDFWRNAVTLLLLDLRWVPTRPATNQHHHIFKIERKSKSNELCSSVLRQCTPFSTLLYPLGCFWCGFSPGLSLLLQISANDHFLADSNSFTLTITVYYPAIPWSTLMSGWRQKYGERLSVLPGHPQWIKKSICSKYFWEKFTEN